MVCRQFSGVFVDRLVGHRVNHHLQLGIINHVGALNLRSLASKLLCENLVAAGRGTYRCPSCCNPKER